MAPPCRGRQRSGGGGGCGGCGGCWRRGGAGAAGGRGLPAAAGAAAATVTLLLLLLTLAQGGAGIPLDAPPSDHAQAAEAALSQAAGGGLSRAAAPAVSAIDEGGFVASSLASVGKGGGSGGGGGLAILGGLVVPTYSAALLACAVVMAVLALGRATGVLPPAWQLAGMRVASVGAAALIVLRLGLEGAEAAAAGELSAHRFAQFFAAGGICALVTHAACTPIDVVKTRVQTAPVGKYTGAHDALRVILRDEGAGTLLKGFGATATGYFLHGAFKYSFYEVFKVILTRNISASALVPPLHIAAASGFLAECIACILLCPMEAVRIRSVADSAFPSGVGAGLALLFKSEGLQGLFKGLPSILLKQVPYTVGQFMSFEVAVTLVRVLVATFSGLDDAPSPTTAAAISTVAGLLAGVMAGIISQPGDTILSKINQGESEGSALAQIARVARALGVRGLFLGLAARLVQVSCMVGAQFFIYDSIKLWCGLTPASAMPVAVVAAAAMGGTAGSAVAADARAVPRIAMSAAEVAARAAKVTVGKAA